MSFEPQHKFRCYCIKKVCSCNFNPNNKSKPNALKSILTNKKDSNTKFTKIRRQHVSSTNTNKTSNKLGLGHSDTSNMGYSRRSSTSTLRTESSASSDGANYSRRGSLGSTISFASDISSQEEPANLWRSHIYQHDDTDSDEYTEQRRRYECSHMPIQQKLQWEQPKEIVLEATLKSTQPTSLDDELMMELQRFRLENANECFNVFRQNDLKMQNVLEPSVSSKRTSLSSAAGIPLARNSLPWSSMFDKQRFGAKALKTNEYLGKSTKEFENDQRKLQRQYFNKLKGPLRKSYALRFQ